MKRKVIRQGNNTLTITLPRKWTEKFGIKPGDEIELDELDIGLLINTKHIAQKSINLNFKDSSPRMIKRILPVFHHSGYDELTILYSTPMQIKMIHDAINVLAGYEIIEQTPTKCVIKTLSETEEMDIDKVINRMFLVLHSMILALNEYSGKKGDMKEILALELTLDRLTNYAERYIHKASPKNSIYLYLLVWNLECMGDYIRDICKKNNSIKLNKKQIKMVKDCADIVDNMRHIFFNFDINEIDQLQKKCDNFPDLDGEIEKSIRSIVQRVHDVLGSITAINYVTTEKKQNI